MSLIIKGGWGIALILTLCLFFTPGGVIDYWRMYQRLQERQDHLIALRKENEQILIEIDQITQDSHLQKKLAREMLGVIAKDEYLILFAKETVGEMPRPVVALPSAL